MTDWSGKGPLTSLAAAAVLSCNYMLGLHSLLYKLPDSCCRHVCNILPGACFLLHASKCCYLLLHAACYMLDATYPPDTCCLCHAV